jgi:hypothetical protein
VTSRFALLAVTISAALVLMTASAQAADVGVSAAPSRIDVATAAGSSVSKQITLSNPFRLAQTYTFAHADLGYETRTYATRTIADSEPETTSFSTRGWFRFTPKFVRLSPSATRNVTLRITIPANTPGGTYVGAVLVQTVPTRSGSVGLSVGAGIPVFVVVDGGDPPRPHVQTFDVPRLVNGGPIKARAVVTNRGDAWYNAEGTIRVDGSDKNSASIASQVVLPNRPRTLLAKAANTKRERTATHFTVGPKHLGIGRHTVILRLRIEPTGTILVTKQTVWVVPNWLRAAALAAATVLAALLNLVLVLRPRR